MQCMNDRNCYSDQNNKDYHNCHFHEQTFDEESSINKTAFLAHAKCNIHVGAELSMQIQNMQDPFAKISLNISKSKVLNNNNRIWCKTHPESLASLMRSVDYDSFPYSMKELSSNKSAANHFSKISERN